MIVKRQKNVKSSNFFSLMSYEIIVSSFQNEQYFILSIVFEEKSMFEIVQKVY